MQQVPPNQIGTINTIYHHLSLLNPQRSTSPEPGTSGASSDPACNKGCFHPTICAQVAERISRGPPSPHPAYPSYPSCPSVAQALAATQHVPRDDTEMLSAISAWSRLPQASGAAAVSVAWSWAWRSWRDVYWAHNTAHVANHDNHACT